MEDTDEGPVLADRPLTVWLCGALLLALVDLLDERRDDLVEVAHDAEVGDREDRGLGSLLMTTIVCEVCIPARCWMAPEMPEPMYSCGETVLPV
jgi:hypothetical protein